MRLRKSQATNKAC